MKIVKIPKREEGQGLVEYALILVLVAIVVIVTLTQIGSLIVLAMATIIGSFTEQPLAGTGHEGIVVSGNKGEDIGAGVCQIDASNTSVVLVEDGDIVTNRTITVNFSFGSGVGGSRSVTIGNSGIGTVNLGTLNNTCPASLLVSPW